MGNIIITSPEELEALIQAAINKAFSQSKQIPQGQSKELFTIEEASQYLNLAKQTLYGLTSKNQIPFIKRGKLYFIKTDLDKWLTDGKQLTKDEIEAEGFDLLRRRKERGK